MQTHLSHLQSAPAQQLLSTEHFSPLQQDAFTDPFTVALAALQHSGQRQFSQVQTPPSQHFPSAQQPASQQQLPEAQHPELAPVAACKEENINAINPNNENSKVRRNMIKFLMSE